MPDRVLILGASARAAAASARRAGLEPFCIDLFADRDTQLLGECLRCPLDDYPEGLFRLAKQAPPMPWMYTGGLENYPELVGELARERELWGNGPDVLLRVRDPRWLAQPLLHHPDLIYPPVVLPGSNPPETGEWLRKPLLGSGGRGVRVATAEDRTAIADPESSYFLQKREYGHNGAVVFRNWRPIGFTHQLVGTPWLHAPPFGYAGSVRWVCALSEFVDILYSIRGLCGVWGVDMAVMSCWCALFEINPRYPASAEVIELATGVSSLTGKAHGRPSVGFQPTPHPIVGKGVYYAPRRLAVPAAGPWDESLRHAADVWQRPDFADIPHPGDTIEPGQPVVTLLADAATEAECVARLKSRAAELDQLFGIPPPRPEE